MGIPADNLVLNCKMDSVRTAIAEGKITTATGFAIVRYLATLTDDPSKIQGELETFLAGPDGVPGTEDDIFSPELVAQLKAIVEHHFVPEILAMPNTSWWAKLTQCCRGGVRF